MFEASSLNLIIKYRSVSIENKRDAYHIMGMIQRYIEIRSIKYGVQVKYCVYKGLWARAKSSILIWLWLLVSHLQQASAP